MSAFAANSTIATATRARGLAALMLSGARSLGRSARTFATETYFFLADFGPRDAGVLADQLKERRILVRSLNDTRLGPGFMRVTTSFPEARFLSAVKAAFDHS